MLKTVFVFFCLSISLVTNKLLLPTAHEQLNGRKGCLCPGMRILTWNINGIRTLPQYHPWNTFKSFYEILDHLKADILCFQETKTSRSALPKSVAVPESYHSFFSFPARRTGYSGVAVYTRVDSVIPIKAEEGLSGLIQPKPPLSTTEIVSERDAYPSSLDEELDLNPNLTELDSEGRALTIDFGLFVLINVYCPNDGAGTEERDKFKMDYHRLLELRVKGLVEKEGREVMVVGDINACAAVIDHCEGPLMVARGQAAGMENEEGFWEKESRRWLRDWLVHEHEGIDRGCLVDIVRQFWPNRQGMYTCWNTKIFARDSNYGTRIDYILVTKGLVPWIRAADVQQNVKGSDHCPVFVDLHEQITNTDGSVTRLRDVLGAGAGVGTPPPRLATTFWDEFSGKQTQLHQFFAKKGPVQSPDPGAEQMLSNDNRAESATVSENVSHASGSQASETTIIATDEITNLLDDTSSEATVLSSQSHISSTTLHDNSHAANTTTQSQTIAPTTGTIYTKKRKILSETPLEKVKKQKSKKVHKNSGSNHFDGQMKLSSFYSKSKTVIHHTVDDFPISASQTAGEEAQVSPYPTDIIDVDDIPEDISPTDDTVYSSSQPLSSQSSFHTLAADDDDPKPTPANNGSNDKKAWSALLAPTPIPLCKVHSEPAKEFTVKKPGPNKGKRFFLCSRPVGPGYDKGLAERLREEVDPKYRCNFFKWSSDVRKEMTRRSEGES